MFGSPGSPAKSTASSQSQSQSTHSLDKLSLTSPSFPHDYDSVSRPDNRLADALGVRDLLASRLITACASIQQKTLVIEQLETEKTALQQSVTLLTAKKEELEGKLVMELQKATKALAIRSPVRDMFEQPPGYDDVRCTVLSRKKLILIYLSRLRAGLGLALELQPLRRSLTLLDLCCRLQNLTRSSRQPMTPRNA